MSIYLSPGCSRWTVIARPLKLSQMIHLRRCFNNKWKSRIITVDLVGTHKHDGSFFCKLTFIKPIYAEPSMLQVWLILDWFYYYTLSLRKDFNLKNHWRCFALASQVRQFYQVFLFDIINKQKNNRSNNKRWLTICLLWTFRLSLSVLKATDYRIVGTWINKMKVTD